MISKEELIDLVSRLSRISDMLVQSFDGKSEFSIWAQTDEKTSEVLKTYSESFTHYLSHVKNRSAPDANIGTKCSIELPAPAIVELRTALNNAKTNPQYLISLLQDERFDTIANFYHICIEKLELIYDCFTKQSNCLITHAYNASSSSSSSSSSSFSSSSSSSSSPSSSSASSAPDNDYIRSLFEINDGDSFSYLSKKDEEDGSPYRCFAYVTSLVKLYKEDNDLYLNLLNSQRDDGLNRLACFLKNSLDNDFMTPDKSCHDTYNNILKEIPMIECLRKSLSSEKREWIRQSHKEQGLRGLEGLTSFSLHHKPYNGR